MVSSKGVIKIYERKNGREGWRKFKLSKEVFQFLCSTKNDRNALATPSPSSSYLNKKLTTKGLGNNISGIVENSPEMGYWQLEPNIVTQKQFDDWLAEFELTPDLLVTYLDRCRFEMVDFGKESNLKKSAINWFYGVMKKRGGSYPEPQGYKSIQEIKLEEEKKILTKLEEIAVEQENIRLKTEFMHMMENTESELFKLCFDHLNDFGKKLVKDNKESRVFQSLMFEEFKRIKVHNP